MPARTRKLSVRQVDGWREGIQVAMIRNRLQKHIAGEIDMTATQIRAAEILLRKVIPDLSSVEYTGSVEHKHASEYSDAELLTFLTRSHDRDSRRGVVEAAAGTMLTASVHGVHDAELEGGEDPPRYQ